MKNLKDILHSIEVESIKGDINLNIDNLSNNSNTIKANGLFIAKKGYKVDGHDFVNNAINNGAVAVVCSENIPIPENITKILGQAKSQIGDNPQVKMMIVQMLKGGLEKKMKMFRENPDNYSLNRQVELINKAINNYSN